MTKDEAIANSDKWEQDIADGIATTIANRDKAASTARARAGASGVRKGTSSWDAMMYKATAPYDSILEGYKVESQSLGTYRVNISNMPDAPYGGSSGVGGGNGRSGDSDTDNSAPDASDPTGREATTATGKAGQEFAEGVGEEVMGTVTGVVAGVTAFGVTHNPNYALDAYEFGHSLGSTAPNTAEWEAMVEDTVGRMGLDQSPVNNMLGVVNTLAVMTGLYGPLKALETLAESAMNGTLEDDAYEVLDYMAAIMDENLGTTPGVNRAGRQMDRTAEENANQDASAGVRGSAKEDATDQGRNTGLEQGGFGTSDNDPGGGGNTGNTGNAGSQSDEQAKENEAQNGMSGMEGMSGADENNGPNGPGGGTGSNSGNEGGDSGGADSENEGSGGETEGSCFVAGTKVLMRDGSSRNIEDVAIGDYVIGQHGEVSKVLGYDRPKLGSRKLYAINGRMPFVTAEHPFMTQNGWMSIDPEATKAEGVDVDVKTLQPGEYLVRFNNSVKLKSLQVFGYEPGTQLYNFALDGNHTYYANGFLVHNKI